jgi:hypothetical protein
MTVLTCPRDSKLHCPLPWWYTTVDVLPKLALKNIADVIVGKPIAVLLHSISDVSDINLLVAFYDIHGEKREVLSFILSRTAHETITESIT